MASGTGQQPGVTHSLTDGRDKVDVTFGIFDSLAMVRRLLIHGLLTPAA